MPAQVIVAGLIGLLIGIVVAGYVAAWRDRAALRKTNQELIDGRTAMLAALAEVKQQRDGYQDDNRALRKVLVESEQAREQQGRELENLKRISGNRLYRESLEDVSFGASQAALLLNKIEEDVATAKRILRRDGRDNQ